MAMQMLIFDFPGVTSRQYDQLCRLLNHGRQLTSLEDFHGAGYRIVSHAAGPAPDGRWCVVDVWESEEALAQFRQKLVPLLKEVGIPPVSPRVVPIHNVVTHRHHGD